MSSMPVLAREKPGPLLADPPRSRSSYSVWLGGAVAVLSVTVWLVFIVNRYLTIHEGWFSYYSYLMQHGKFPYRDFYFFTQPLHLLIANAVISLGDHLIYYRIYGLVERVAITALYYYLLSRSFSAAAALCGTVASSILFLAYPTDAFASYLYTCLLFALATVACFYQAWHLPQRRTLWMFLAGVSASLSFFSKQSNGLLIIAGGALTILIVSDSLRGIVADFLKFSLGVIAAAIPFVVWLVINGAWNAYLSEVFLGAASSKGGLRAVLFGFISRQLKPASIETFAFVALALALLLWSKQLRILPNSAAARLIPNAYPFAAFALSMLITMLLVHYIYGRPLWVLSKSTETIVNVLLYAVTPILLYIAYCRFRYGPGWVKGNEVPIALVITSWFWTYSCGMSWNIAEQSVIPSLGLLLAFAYDRFQFRQTNWVSISVLIVSIAIMSIGAWHKWNLAFSWEGWYETVTDHGVHSKHPEIADYLLKPSEAVIYDTILDDVAKYTKPGEPIVTFPTIPVFNYIGSHPQPTFAPVHYWDVCPDNVARQDAARVLAAKPRMIIELQLAEWVWHEHDAGWRAGRRSGQRDFRDALNTLTSSGDYRLVDKLFTPYFHMPIEVWVRER